ncbi:MAG: hypothetical protein ACOYO1_02420 [Bacteroidales bacterium]
MSNTKENAGSAGTSQKDSILIEIFSKENSDILIQKNGLQFVKTTKLKILDKFETVKQLCVTAQLDVTEISIAEFKQMVDLLQCFFERLPQDIEKMTTIAEATIEQLINEKEAK